MNVLSKHGPAEIDVDAAWHDPKLANVLYHDWEAANYDEKWSISYDERCVTYARDRFVAIAGAEGWPDCAHAVSLDVAALRDAGARHLGIHPVTAACAAALLRARAGRASPSPPSSRPPLRACWPRRRLRGARRAR